MRELAAAAIAVVEPGALLRQALIDLSSAHSTFTHRPCFVVAAGKASSAMLDAFTAHAPVVRSVVAPYSHPLPDEASVHARLSALRENIHRHPFECESRGECHGYYHH